MKAIQLDPICAAVTAAWKQGIVVVVAAGNLGRDGYATITSPGNDPYAITVGAMKTEGTPQTSDDLIASYSSRGPTWIDQEVKPDIVAPGNLVRSLLAPGSTLSQEYPQNVVPASYYMQPGYSAPAEYFELSGTSMATPVVSGAAAILIESQPSLTPDNVKARLMKTASKTFPAFSTATDPTTGDVYVDTYDIFTVGAGYLNIPAALNNHDATVGVALSPSCVLEFAAFSGDAGQSSLFHLEQRDLESRECLGTAGGSIHGGRQFSGMGNLGGMGQFGRVGNFGRVGQLSSLGNLGGMGHQRQRERRELAT